MYKQCTWNRRPCLSNAKRRKLTKSEQCSSLASSVSENWMEWEEPEASVWTGAKGASGTHSNPHNDGGERGFPPFRKIRQMKPRKYTHCAVTMAWIKTAAYRRYPTIREFRRAVKTRVFLSRLERGAVKKRKRRERRRIKKKWFLIESSAKGPHRHLQRKLRVELRARNFTSD